MVPNVAVERSGWAVRQKGGGRGQQGDIRNKKKYIYIYLNDKICYKQR